MTIKNRTLFPLLAALAAALPATPASAGLRHQTEVSVQAGIFNPEGDIHLDAGPAYGARAGFFVTNRVSVEAMFFRANSQTEGGRDVSVLNPGLGAYYHFLRFGKFMPFLQAGAGLMSINTEGAKDHTNFSFHWGGGLKYFWKPALLLRADVSDIIDSKPGVGTHNLLAVAGFSYLFGAPAAAAAADSDGDGVPDDKDQCPGTPAGTRVGPTGCPEGAGEIPADKWVLEGVRFEVGSDILTAPSLLILDGAAQILLPRKSVRIEVQGHTDSTGDERSNLLLSEKRAVAVKNYLAAKGVEPSRMETRGYGSSMPAGDNATEEGRAANRRIEFKVLGR